jgi:hypothetical protein
MKKYIEISDEVLERLTNGKYVEGSLHKDPDTGKLVFKAYVRLSREQKDRAIKALEHGWLKESPTRYKFFNSVKKDIGYRLVNVAMHRELKDAMNALEVEQIIDRV